MINHQISQTGYPLGQNSYPSPIKIWINPLHSTLHPHFGWLQSHFSLVKTWLHGSWLIIIASIDQQFDETQHFATQPSCIILHSWQYSHSHSGKMVESPSAPPMGVSGIFSCVWFLHQLHASISRGPCRLRRSERLLFIHLRKSSRHQKTGLMQHQVLKIWDIAIENGNLSWIFPWKIAIFRSYVNVYQRVGFVWLPPDAGCQSCSADPSLFGERCWNPIAWPIMAPWFLEKQTISQKISSCNIL